MVEKLEFRIEFPDETHMAIDLRIEAPTSRHPYGEGLLFACMALRQMHNIGTNHPVSRSLARALAFLQDSRSPLRVLLGPPQFSLQLIRDAMKQGARDPMENIVSSDILIPVPFRNQKGKRRFLGTLKFDNRRALFLLRPKGFTLLGHSVNYYFPLSVTGLLHHLAGVRVGDINYQTQLRRIANACGNALLAGQVTILTQPRLAIEITEDSMAAP